MKCLLLCLICMELTVYRATGVYEVEINLISFQNPSGRCDSCRYSDIPIPQCCDDNMSFPGFDQRASVLPTPCPSQDSCDIMLVYCARPLRSTGNACSAGSEMQSNSILENTNIISTEEFSGLIGDGPLVVRGNPPWNGIQIFLRFQDHNSEGNSLLIDSFAIDINDEEIGEMIPSATFTGRAGIGLLTARFELQCGPGWYGPRCTIPCPNFANCETCVGVGYVGDYCSRYDCGVARCNSNGVCADSERANSEPTCVCRRGFEGERCELHSCLCSENGRCMGSGTSGFTCLCNDGYTGTHCEDKVPSACGSVDCGGNGECVEQGSTFTCNCNPGFTGRLCQATVDFCATVDCGRGRCQNDFNTFRCFCDPGFEGALCNINTDECQSRHIDCSGHGTCVDGINEASCSCNPGYTGITCGVDIDECAEVNCNNGKCMAQVNSFTCHCDQGFTGQLCETKINHCQSVSCSDHGVCMDRINSFTCSCRPGYTGRLCEIDVNDCNATSCNSNGDCIDLVDSFTCICNDGFSGEYCQTREGFPVIYFYYGGGGLGGLLFLIIFCCCVYCCCHCISVRRKRKRRRRRRQSRARSRSRSEGGSRPRSSSTHKTGGKSRDGGGESQKSDLFTFSVIADENEASEEP